MTTTTNGNPSYRSTGRPHIDYFAGATRQSPEDTLTTLAQSCIDSDARLAVATFFQKRDCRGGAGERKPFFMSMQLLPDSLRARLYPIVPQYGYWQDLNALARAIPEDRPVIADLLATYLFDNIVGFESGVLHRPLEKWLPTEQQRDDRVWGAAKKIIQAYNRRAREINIKEQVVEKLGRDFQQQIQKVDPHSQLVAGKTTQWSVMEDGEHPWEDQIADKINELSQRFGYIFTKSQQLPDTIHKMTRTSYRKWCSFMRAYYEVVEHYKSEGQWDLIDYSKVPSLAFDRTKEQFAEHSPERFRLFMQRVDRGEQKINVGRLMPCQLLGQESSEVRDTQWRLVVEETKKFYSEVPLDNIFHPQNTIHVADVSGSMTSSLGGIRPIDVALSLAFIGGEVGQRPIYTFSTSPKRYEPTWSTLTEAQQQVDDTNFSTNLRALIDRIHTDFPQAPGSIFIYTDGGFDMMCSEDPVSAAEYIQQKFGPVAPTIVFWNVAGNIADFATATQHDKIIQVAGFSKDLYQIFTRLTDVENFSLETFFRQAVLSDRYQIPLDIYDTWKLDQDAIAAEWETRGLVSFPEGEW